MIYRERVYIRQRQRGVTSNAYFKALRSSEMGNIETNTTYIRTSTKVSVVTSNAFFSAFRFTVCRYSKAVITVIDKEGVYRVYKNKDEGGHL